MGGLSGVLGHLEICDNVTVGAHTLITKSIKSSGNYVGIMPVQSHIDWSKSAVFIKKRQMNVFSKDDIEKYLPHRDPFLFIDEVISIEEGNKIHAAMCIRDDNVFLGGTSQIIQLFQE